MRFAAKQIFSAIRSIALPPCAVRFCWSVFRSSFSLLVSCLCTRWLCRSFAVLSPARRRPLALWAAGCAPRCGKDMFFCLPKRTKRATPQKVQESPPRRGAMERALAPSVRVLILYPENVTYWCRFHVSPSYFFETFFYHGYVQPDSTALLFLGWNDS